MGGLIPAGNHRRIGRTLQIVIPVVIMVTVYLPLTWVNKGETCQISQSLVTQSIAHSLRRHTPQQAKCR